MLQFQILLNFARIHHEFWNFQRCNFFDFSYVNLAVVVTSIKLELGRHFRFLIMSVVKKL